LSVRFSRILSVENNLSYTGTIAQIDKREFAKIATLRDPTHQYHLLPNVAGTQIST